MSPVRYKAFISYSHDDESWADWLHRALETYRVPKRLVGSDGLNGKIPARLAPIFRDREELSSASDLSGRIREALADSDALVVICSPAAAQSRWVNEEIRVFRLLGKGDRIYCVIVDGDPQSREPDHACFPPALLESDDGRPVEPLAADARKWADGKPLARLKIVSGVLGIRLDELRRREQQRKRKRQAVTLLGLFLAIVLIAVSIQSRMAEQEARLRQETLQASAERMLAQFLDQAERLSDVADLETRKVFSETMSAYLADLDQAALTAESRKQLGVAMYNRGDILARQGYFEEALQASVNARDTLQRLVDDAPGDREALYELSQAEYYVGQVNLEMGRMKEAEASFHAYSEVSHALHRLEPENAIWTMEAAYAQSNLGRLEWLKLNSDPNLMLGFYLSALELNKEAAQLDESFEHELAQSFADVAEGWLNVCGLEQALEARLMNTELAAKYYRANPANNNFKIEYAFALSGLAWAYQQKGSLDLALENIQQSINLFEELVAEDPSNAVKRWNLAFKSGYEARLTAYLGDEDEGWKMSLSVDSVIRELESQSQDIGARRELEFGRFLADFADLAYRRGEVELGETLLAESLTRLSKVAKRNPEDILVMRELAMSYFYYWENQDARLPEVATTIPLESIKDALNLQGCTGLTTASRIALMTGRREEAQAYVSQLLVEGYDEPEFRRFCHKYHLCTETG